MRKSSELLLFMLALSLFFTIGCSDSAMIAVITVTPDNGQMPSIVSDTIDGPYILLFPTAIKMTADVMVQFVITRSMAVVWLGGRDVMVCAIN